MSTCLIIFAKSPIPGKVKTRLIPHITSTKAAELNEAFIADTISTALKLKCRRITVAYSPGYAEKTVQRLCGQSVDYLPQKGDGLGERMKNAFNNEDHLWEIAIAVAVIDVPHHYATTFGIEPRS